MDKIVSVVKLMAKTGLFFANIDGKYTPSEKNCIDSYISNLESIGELNSDLRHEIEMSLQQTYTREEIIADTQTLLDGFSNEEQTAILQAISAFINSIIHADSETHRLENQNLKAWEAIFAEK